MAQSFRERVQGLGVAGSTLVVTVKAFWVYSKVCTPKA